ncbi:MAG: hypothetical protein HXS50_04815 [Theionarchaea archaeon]|nr:hypothetical protein [Theionarchaea archaeon]
MMRSDPLFSISLVQASLRSGDFPLNIIHDAQKVEVVPRLLRLYMPRSYSDLVSRFDVIVFNNANALVLADYNEMLADGASEGGLGVFMSGGWEGFGGVSGFPPWGETPIGSLLPTGDLPGEYYMAGRLVIDEPNDELMSSIPWESPRALWSERSPEVYHNVVTVKPGAIELAHVLMRAESHPGFVTWKLGNGARAHILSFTGETDNPERWEHFIDMGCNLMIYVDGRPVPQDLAIVHLARIMIQQVMTRRTLILSLVDFIESFGANTQPITDGIEEADGAISQARPLYLDLQFLESTEIYQKADEMLKDVEILAMKVKDRTLFWVYLIEWLSVTGTFLICGSILWALMVRRKLYLDIDTTRFR